MKYWWDEKSTAFIVIRKVPWKIAKKPFQHTGFLAAGGSADHDCRFIWNKVDLCRAQIAAAATRDFSCAGRSYLRFYYLRLYVWIAARCRSPPSALVLLETTDYKRKEIVMSAEMINKVESLLKNYREREWKIAVLQHKMKNPVRVTETEVAEAMNYAHGDGQGYTPGRVSNKTLYIALNYKEQAERLNTEAAESIAAELFALEHEHEQLKLYISLIDKREADVLMLLYAERESAVNVAEKLGLSKRTITRIHNAAVAHLAEMYEYAEKYDG